MPEAARDTAQTRHLTTRNPATGEKLKDYALMSDQEVEDLIQATHSAFENWRRTSFEERGRHLRRFAEILREEKEEMARLMSTEMGKLFSASKGEIEACAEITEYTIEEMNTYLQDEERPLQSGGKGIITYSPIGVIYGIQPWNFPLYQVVRYAIANIAAGNTVLLKHAADVTGSALKIEEMMKKAGFPDNVFTVLVIDHDQSDTVIENRLVRGVTLTGSPRAGAHVGAKAAKALKKSVLELGSNDAYIVLEDADLEKAVKHCVAGRIYNNGETCVAAKRFIVVDAVYEKFRDAYVEQMKAVKLGDPFDADTQLGPMVRENLRADLHDQVVQSLKHGAKLLCGGEIPEGPGFFYPATVLEDVKPGQPAYDEELFGPVASLIRVKDEAEAIRTANDSVYGLGGGIFTKDVERAKRIARDEFDTGMVFINGFDLAQPNMPFGGVKDSGYGREHGGFGIREFVNVKAINIVG